VQRIATCPAAIPWQIRLLQRLPSPTPLLLSVACGLALLASGPARALEALDGRFQAHGFYEMQLRTLSSGYTGQWDVSQWYNILDLELELDIAPDGIGPFDLLSGYARVEGRFDCIYSRGCGMFTGIDVYGDRARRLPERLNDAREITDVGAVGIPFDSYATNLDTWANDDLDPVSIHQVSGYHNLARQSGADRIFGNPSASSPGCFGQPPSVCDQLAGGGASIFTLPGGSSRNDDPFEYVFERFLDFRFAQIERAGGSDGGLPTLQLGPWLPGNRVQTNAALADRVNPFDAARTSPIVRAATFNAVLLPPTNGTPAAAQAAANAARGAGALPFRPIPVVDEGRSGEADGVARGLYYPSPALRRLLASGDLDSYDFNYDEIERAFNRGASQSQTGELKEVYVDAELFDSRLWLRLGRQQIVWGKTELFRTTDQFNPQDLALASLPSLEESRIALWALRGIWSFYEVGPLSDVRAELAVGLDEFVAADLGACGEPYAPNPTCRLTFASLSHGLVGAGIAGFDRPPSPWDSLRGWEIGGRLEFRWERFSFQISDFWGYEDLPHLVPIHFYERNVDPLTGRPRIAGSRGACTTGNEPDCLLPGPTDRSSAATSTDRLLDPRNALDSHHANQQIFAVICSSSVGFSGLDPSACAQSVFASPRQPLPGISIANVLSGLVYGGPNANTAQLFAQWDPAKRISLPLVTLHKAGGRDLANPGGCLDPRTGVPCGGPGAGNLPTAGDSLAAALTPEQEALLGCGPYWGSNCDDSGIDLLNAEASVIVQSFTGFEGTTAGWDTGSASAQPGTVGFFGGPRCTTADIGGSADPSQPSHRLPGCRGPGDPGYDANIDGDPSQVRTLVNAPTTVGLSNPQPAGTLGVHPFTGQPWQTELAAASWNLQTILVAQSANFLTANAWTPGQCGFVTPQYCDNVNTMFNVIGVQRRTLRAGGNESFGRRSFRWHSGGEAVARYDKRNVLGFALDFAEDRSKASFGVESTWIHGVPEADNDADDGLTDTDQINLTLSVDRPTFINFLNANRTFLINSQWFFQYKTNYGDGMPSNGPWNVLGMLNVSTGYANDRLLPQFTAVWDFHSRSGALLPEITYRMTSNFSVGVGMAIFTGRTQLVDMPVRPLSPAANRQGPDAYLDPVENGLSAVRERDEIYLRIRYTF